MNSIDLHSIRIPLSQEDFKILASAIRKGELIFKDLPSELKRAFNEFSDPDQEIQRQRMIDLGLMGEFD